MHQDRIKEIKDSVDFSMIERQFFPVRYRMPNWVWPLDLLSMAAFCHRENISRNLTKFSLGNSTAFYRAMVCATRFDSPVYLVQPDCMEALNRTECPKDLWMSQLEWPFDGLILSFPRGAIRNDVNGDVQHAVVARDEVEPGKYMIRVALVMEDSSTYNFSEYIDSFDIFSMFSKDMVVDGLRQGSEQSDVVEQDFFRRIVKLCFSCIMLMNAAPEEIVYEPDLVRGKPKKRDPRGWVNPRIIGKTFTASRKCYKDSQREFSGSVREHWRKGHWRNQPHGPKDNQKHKLIWLRPTKVGKHEE